MREAFMKMDKTKTGMIGERDLKEVLQMWTGMTLTDRDMRAVVRRFNPKGDGKIRCVLSEVIAFLCDCFLIH